jgi:hypothetical protein
MTLLTRVSTTSVELFTHPALAIELVTLLELGKQWNRVLVIMTKCPDCTQVQLQRVEQSVTVQQLDVEPKLVAHMLHDAKLPKLSRVLEENCIGYVSAPSQHAPQIPVHVWEVIRRNELQNFLDNFVARGASTS